MTTAQYDNIKTKEQLRDAFAMAALQGHLANTRIEFKDNASMAISCYRLADLMLATREGSTT